MAFRSSTEHSGPSGTGTTRTINYPASIAANDILLLGIHHDTVTVTMSSAPTGFTLLNSHTQSNPDNASYYLYYRRATGGEGASVSFTLSSDTSCVATMGAWSGRHTSTAPSVIATSPVVSATASPISAAITGITASTNDDIATFLLLDVTNDAISWTSTPPTNYTEARDVSTNWAYIAMAFRDNVSSGATGGLTFTATGTGGTAGYSGWTVRMPIASGATNVDVNLTGIAITSSAGSLSVGISEPSVTLTGVSATGSAGTVTATQTNTGTSGWGTAMLDFGGGATTTTVSVVGQSNITAGSFAEAFLMGSDSTVDHTQAQHRDVVMELRVTNVVAGTGFDIKAVAASSQTGKYLCRWVWAK